MSKAAFINDNKGIVINVSKDKTKIKVLLPKGGIVKARNEGFEKGDEVCFIINATKTKIVKVIPKLIADVTTTLGSSQILRAAAEEQPEDLDQDFDEHEFFDEEITIEEDVNEPRDKTTGNADEREGEAEFTLGNGS